EVTRSRSGRIQYLADYATNVFVDGGSGANTYDIGWAGPITLNAGSGPLVKQVNVTATGGPLDVTGGSSTYLRVGGPDSGGMQRIWGAVHVSGPDTVLILDDYFDAASRSVTMSVSGSTGSVTGLAPAPVTFTADLNRVAITGGVHGNTFTISGTLGWTILNTGGVAPTSVNVQGTSTSGPLDLLTDSGDTINITNAANRLDSIAHVTVNSMSFGGTVNVNDSDFGGDETYTVTGTTVTVGRAPGFLLTYNGIAN